MPEWMVYFNIFASIFWAIQIVFSFLWHRKHRHLRDVQLDHIPRLSVIVPVFNESNHEVQKVIDSILMQRHVDVEVVLIDDGSYSPLVVSPHSNVMCMRTEENHGKRQTQKETIRYTSTE